MTALQSIIKEAKVIRKKSPKMEWKKAVAQASAIYASKHKGKSPVGKKHAVKKKAAKKKAVKRVGVIKKKAIRKSATKRKPTEKTVLKSIKHAVTVQKAHMSGMNAKIVKRLQDITNEIEQREDVIASVMHRKKDLISQHGKSWYTKWMKDAKGYLAECKKHKSELKRFI